MEEWASSSPAVSGDWYSNMYLARGVSATQGRLLSARAGGEERSSRLHGTVHACRLAAAPRP